MQYPRISSRAWFWGLTLAVFIWAWAGTRTMSPNPAAPSFMQSTQSSVIVSPVNLLLVPGSWLGSLVQRFFAGVVSTFTTSRAQVETADSLKQQNLRLQDQ